MGYINKIEVGNNTHLIEPTLYAVATKNETAYTASIDSNFNLVLGVVVNIKFGETNEDDATLNINSTGAKNIFYNNANITANQLKANHTYSLSYDGVQWQLIGDIDADNANTATALQTGRTLQVDLSKTTASSVFNGSANINDIGVSNILSTSNGGTGKDSWTSYSIPYASTTGLAEIAPNTTTTKMFLSMTGNGTQGAVPTWSTLSASDIPSLDYLPLSGGVVTGNIRRYYNSASDEPMITMLSNNKDTILWEMGHGTSSTNVTTSDNHYKLIYKGTGASNSNSNYLQLVAHKNDENDDLIAVQINEIGIVSLPQMSTGSASTPIYINSNGNITSCSQYAGGTAITLNGTSKSASTASFYAPTSSGTSGQVLISGGSSNAPSFRALIDADIPNSLTLTSISSAAASGTNASISFYRGGTTSNKIAEFDTSGNFIPVSNSTNTIGTSTNPWHNIYATTFTGDLSGKVKVDKTNITSTTTVSTKYLVFSSTLGSNSAQFK